MSSLYALEGTAAHDVAARCLRDGKDAVDFIGEEVTIVPQPHSDLGASISDRWIHCPGSVRMSRSAPKEDKKTERIVVTEEMAEAIQTYVDEIRSVIANLPGATMAIEMTFQIKGHPDLWGTCDCCIYRPYGELVVIDYKHGAGVAVDAKGNAQLRFYALGGFQLFPEAAFIRYGIVQPRAHHKEGRIRYEIIEPRELERWGDEVLIPAAKSTEAPNAPLIPSEKSCRFCRASATCPAILRSVSEAAMVAFSPVGEETPVPVLPDPESLSVERIGKILTHASLIESWLDNCRAYVRREIENGRTDLGFKLVAGRNSRKWSVGEEQVEKTLKELGLSAHKQKILSPAQAEAAAKKAKVNASLIIALVDTVPGASTLVPISIDARLVIRGKNNASSERCKIRNY